MHYQKNDSVNIQKIHFIGKKHKSLLKVDKLHLK